MSGDTVIKHEMEAYNLSASSENKIHDDTVAQKFGFQGGLVPGVEVYAYMMNPAIRHFGPDWLASGNGWTFPEIDLTSFCHSWGIEQLSFSSPTIVCTTRERSSS